VSWISLEESHLAGDEEVCFAGTVGSTAEDQVPVGDESPVETAQESLSESIPESISISQVSCTLPVTRPSHVSSKSCPVDNGTSVHEDTVPEATNMVEIDLMRARRRSAHVGLIPR
jgi:hypothetical protein